ncbi:TPA: hypothetical protein ACGZ99_002904, partial [Elizabethkingia anophelis]
QVETKISKLSTIDDSKLHSTLLENNKLIPSWENLLYDYNTQDTERNSEKDETKISKSSIEFINIIQNAEKLSKIKIPKEVNSVNVYAVFWKKLIQTNEIEDQSYNFITQSSPWWYSDLNFESLSKNKIISLINNSCINATEKSFNLLKEKSDGLNIYLLEKRKKLYSEILDKLVFDNKDLELVLKSTILNNTEKLKILNNCSEEVITTDDNLKLLSSIILKDSSFAINDRILSSILLNNQVPIVERIKLFIKNSNKYEISFIIKFLTNLGGNYAWINDKSSKARILSTDDNLQLLNILVAKGYISSFTRKESDLRVNHKRK